VGAASGILIALRNGCCATQRALHHLSGPRVVCWVCPRCANLPGAAGFLGGEGDVCVGTWQQASRFTTAIEPLIGVFTNHTAMSTLQACCLLGVHEYAYYTVVRVCVLAMAPCHNPTQHDLDSIYTVILRFGPAPVTGGTVCLHQNSIKAAGANPRPESVPQHFI
jgi:hypothetical protein